MRKLKNVRLVEIRKQGDELRIFLPKDITPEESLELGDHTMAAIELWEYENGTGVCVVPFTNIRKYFNSLGRFADDIKTQEPEDKTQIRLAKWGLTRASLGIGRNDDEGENTEVGRSNAESSCSTAQGEPHDPINAEQGEGKRA